MYIGVKLGRMKPTEDREKAYVAATSFLSAFEQRFGSLICYELIGCDFRTPEGRKRWEKLKETQCANFVKGTVEILLDLEKQAVKEK